MSALFRRLYRKPRLRLAPEGGAWLANSLHTEWHDAMDTQKVPALSAAAAREVLRAAG